ncbi:WD40-repeat-containing domain protein, partial [Mycena leptocephala]
SNFLLPVAFSPDGSHIASGSDDHAVGIWPLSHEIPSRMLLGHSAGVFTVGFSPDGSRICSGSGDFSLRVWSFLTGELQHTATSHCGRVHSAEFSCDGVYIIVYDTGGVSVPTYHVTMPVTAVDCHADSVKIIVFSPDGNLVASGSTDSSVRVWSL